MAIATGQFLETNAVSYGAKNEFINNETAFLKSFYHGEELLTVEKNGVRHIAPYKVLHIYQEGTKAFDNWGDVVLQHRFELANDLNEFGEHATNRFRADGKLNQNNPAPRVNYFSMSEDGVPYILLSCGNAFYEDQVKTNLVIDWTDFSQFNQSGVQTLREYNQNFYENIAGGPKGSVPSFQNSLLANTLGVAIGVVARENNDPNSPFIATGRVRSDNVAVYQGMMSPILTFAAKNNATSGVYNGSLKDFLKADVKEELLQEIGLKHEEIVIKPLALTQDLGRGGKPQLFCVAEAQISLAEMNARLTDTKGEYEGSVVHMKDNTASMMGVVESPEMQAFKLLIDKQYNQKYKM